MKRMIFVTVFTTLFMVFGVFINIKSNEFSNLFKDDMKIILKHIENDNWDEANQFLDKSYKNWCKTNNIWYLFLNHENLDNVTLHYNTINDGIELQDKALCIEQVHLLIHSLHHVTDRESINLNNII